MNDEKMKRSTAFFVAWVMAFCAVALLDKKAAVIAIGIAAVIEGLKLIYYVTKA